VQHPSIRPLTRRVLDHFDTGGLDLAASALRISSDVFTSRERFDADRAMMRRVPHVVGWAGEIPEPGDYTTKDVAGAPVLLVRSKDGTARAFVNACVHRGSQVAEGCGTAARFTCPYHAWTYDTDGRLAGVPARDMFAGVDTDELGLVALPCAEPRGLLVVALDPTTSVDGAIDELLPELAAFDFSRYAHVETRRFDLRANWKFVVDVNFEGYHFPYLHKNTLAAYCTNNSVFDTFGRHCRWAFPFRNILDLRELPESDWPEKFIGTVVYGVFPSCVLIESPMSTQMLRIYPGDEPDRSVVYLTGGSFEPIVDEEDRARRIAGVEGACEVLRDEDFPAAEGCQLGVEHARRHVIVGRSEPLLQHLHQAWDTAVGDRVLERMS
jgi:carnitine monooxygenase subunit